jgi:hypothetical protein
LPSLARQSAMETMRGGPVLAGFCLSLVGLGFSRSGHCLSDEIPTTTTEECKSLGPEIECAKKCPLELALSTTRCHKLPACAFRHLLSTA